MTQTPLGSSMTERAGIISKTLVSEAQFKASRDIAGIADLSKTLEGQIYLLFSFHVLLF